MSAQLSVGAEPCTVPGTALVQCSSGEHRGHDLGLHLPGWHPCCRGSPASRTFGSILDALEGPSSLSDDPQLAMVLQSLVDYR